MCHVIIHNEEEFFVDEVQEEKIYTIPNKQLLFIRGRLCAVFYIARTFALIRLLL